MPSSGRRLTDQPPPPGLGLPHAKHSEVETVSLINELLWNKAQWRGTVFLHPPGASAPPILAPLFANGDAASEIFREWAKELGPTDENDRLRIAIVRGVNRSNPSAYRIVIGINPETIQMRTGAKFVVMLGRIQLMTPASDINLNQFLDAFQKRGKYLLAYAVGDPSPGTVTAITDNYIVKHRIHVRQAWQIGPHDLDAMAISADDDIIIPPSELHAPVLKVLERLRSREASNG